MIIELYFDLKGRQMTYTASEKRKQALTKNGWVKGPQLKAFQFTFMQDWAEGEVKYLTSDQALKQGAVN